MSWLSMDMSVMSILQLKKDVYVIRTNKKRKKMNIDYVDYILNKKYAAEERAEKAEEMFSSDMDDIQREIDKLMSEAQDIAKYYEDEFGYIFDPDEYLSL